MLTTEKFNEIFREHYHSLKLYARRFLSDSDAAGDIVQDVFYNLWKMRKDFHPRDSMKSYLFSAVYYKCLNYLKHEKLLFNHNETTINVNDEFRRFYVDEIINYQENLFTDDSKAQIKSAVDDLPDQCQRIFLLSRKFGLKNREIADFLEISLKVVEKQISKALKLMRSHLKVAR